MTIQRGVSLYSYQQSQFFGRLGLEDQIREVATNLDGADGLELVDEMSLHYPDPGKTFVTQWFRWMDEYRTRPVALDVGMDVLQFRDHVMTYQECADRLIHDIRLAKSMGFSIVRTLSVVPTEIIEMALPYAEELDIKVGKEIHQPMRLEGPQVAEILDLAERVGSEHVGIVPDLGIFQFRPSEVQLAWFGRKGAQQDARDAAVELSLALRNSTGPFPVDALKEHTAGNLRGAFSTFLRSGAAEGDLMDIFQATKMWANARVGNPQAIDYSVTAEALLFSHTSTETLRELLPRIIHIHGKFNNMSPVPGEAGRFQETTIDYPSVIAALKDGDYDGYIDTEYEGQRYFQDRGIQDLEDEVEQVRRHQEMLKRLIEAS
jgi:hypothetical protein